VKKARHFEYRVRDMRKTRRSGEEQVLKITTIYINDEKIMQKSIYT